WSVFFENLNTSKALGYTSIGCAFTLFAAPYYLEAYKECLLWVQTVAIVVFIVGLSFPVAISFFQRIKKMNFLSAEQPLSDVFDIVKTLCKLSLAFTLCYLVNILFSAGTASNLPAEAKIMGNTLIVLLSLYFVSAILSKICLKNRPNPPELKK